MSLERAELVERMEEKGRGYRRGWKRGGGVCRKGEGEGTGLVEMVEKKGRGWWRGWKSRGENSKEGESEWG